MLLEDVNLPKFFLEILYIGLYSKYNPSVSHYSVAVIKAVCILSSQIESRMVEKTWGRSWRQKETPAGA